MPFTKLWGGVPSARAEVGWEPNATYFLTNTRFRVHSGAANHGRSRLLGGQSRLKAGCGQDCPPHGAKSMWHWAGSPPQLRELPHLTGHHWAMP
jgi:hypothetical protein